MAAHTDWGRFVQQLRHYASACVSYDANGECSPASSGALQKLSDLLDSDDFMRFSEDHARSLNAELHELFGDMCFRGAIEVARIFVLSF